MKPPITNLKHKQFCLLIETVLQNLKDRTSDENDEMSVKMAELETNKQGLEDLYSDYQLKLKQICELLEKYEKLHQSTRIQLRKMQLLLKFKCDKVTN